jgi:hypothetical protein
MSAIKPAQAVVGGAKRHVAAGRLEQRRGSLELLQRLCVVAGVEQMVSE